MKEFNCTYLVDKLAKKYKSNIEVCNISADTRKE